MASKGQKLMAHTPINCLECKTLIPVGVRRPNQTLCLPTDEERRENPKKLSRCQVIYYNKKKQAKKAKLNFIICDTCKKKIQPETPLQVRCISGIEGVLSPCQIKARNRIAREHHEAKKGEEEAKAKYCLKCGEKFTSEGDFNRVCDSCNAANSRVARKMHKVGAY